MRDRTGAFKTRIAAGLAACVLAAGLAAPALADREGHGGRAMGPRMMRRALASLDLSADQRDKIQAIVKGAAPDLKALHDKLRQDRDALNAAADAQPANPSAVGAAFLKLRGDREAIKAEAAKVRQAIDTALTPDQRSRLEGFLSAHRQGRGRFRSGGPDRDNR